MHYITVAATVADCGVGRTPPCSIPRWDQMGAGWVSDVDDVFIFKNMRLNFTPQSFLWGHLLTRTSPPELQVGEGEERGLGQNIFSFPGYIRLFSLLQTGNVVAEPSSPLSMVYWFHIFLYATPTKKKKRKESAVSSWLFSSPLFCDKEEIFGVGYLYSMKGHWSGILCHWVFFVAYLNALEKSNGQTEWNGEMVFESPLWAMCNSCTWH